MSEIKTAEEIVNNLTVNDDGFIHIKPDTLKLLFEKHHLQFRPTDEDIWDMVQEKYFRIYIDNKPEKIKTEVNAMKQLRDQIFKTKEE